MPRTCLFIVVLIFSTFSLQAPALTQVGYNANSIEWLTASSDTVVTATVTDLNHVDRAPGPGEKRSQWQWVTVTLAVDRTLKGESPETIRFVIDQHRGAELLGRWQTSRQRVLWFFAKRGEKPEQYPEDHPGPVGKLRPRVGSSLGRFALDLGPTDQAKPRIPYPMFTHGFKVLDTPDALIDAVKAEAKHRPERYTQSISLPILGDIALRTGRRGDANAVTVPFDDRLVEQAKRWTQSDERWLRDAGKKVLTRLDKEQAAESR